MGPLHVVALARPPRPGIAGTFPATTGSNCVTATAATADDDGDDELWSTDRFMLQKDAHCKNKSACSKEDQGAG